MELTDEEKIQKLKDFLFTKQLGIWTIKDIIFEVRDIFDIHR